VAEFLTEYGLFLAKSLTVLVVALVLLSAMAGLALRNRRGSPEGAIEVKRLNDRFDDLRLAVQSAVLDDASFKKRRRRRRRPVRRGTKKGLGMTGSAPGPLCSISLGISRPRRWKRCEKR